MLIKRKQSFFLPENQVTDEKLFNNRRVFLKHMLMAGLVSPLIGCGVPESLASETKKDVVGDIKSLKLTSYKNITTYNNFYELGTGKDDPVNNAHLLKTDPWSIKIDGECNKPGTYSFEDILKPHDLEERIYRFRCVETWAAVIPWLGFPLAELLKRFEPTTDAKFVAFETVYNKKNLLPGQRGWLPTIDWPYREGLRIDEAMHPLSFLATGLYGKSLPNQNGAPIRLVVPWKYGFKSIKSIVRISFTKTQPQTSWNMKAPQEYGFYSNVNPQVSHPRWSQASERRLGSLLRKRTLMFNGYEQQVSAMYAGMDLAKKF